MSIVLLYLKFYREPDNKYIKEEAYKSAHEYFGTGWKSQDEFVAYQRGYISAYRHNYAKAKLKKYLWRI